LRLPSDFPKQVAVAFDPHTNGAVVRFELPPREVIPKLRGYQYIKSKDEVRPLSRPSKEVGDLYRSVVSQVALLCIRDTFEADSQIESVGFNGHLRATDPATGQAVHPCLISLSVDRSRWGQLSLHQVRPEACLRHLNALVSPHPYDLEPVRPIQDFDRTKYSFVEGWDVVSKLDARTVLTDMTPTEFEHLVRQLCEAQGMQSWTTRQSNDDGVDAVVFNPAPLVGGLCIVQAKRYKGVIGVQHLRELAGAMEEKKAGRGILITTSWFTAGCWQKKSEHNRMELIDGQNLVSLIKDHLHMDVLAGAMPPSPRKSE
jgi:restriction system protein